MMTKITYDEKSFTDTAEVLLTTNRACRGMSVERLVEIMKYDHVPSKAGYWGTYGFYVSTSLTNDGLYSQATVAPWLIRNYVERLAEKYNKIERQLRNISKIVNEE